MPNFSSHYLQEMIIVKSKHTRKLNTLCNRILPLKESNDKFINFSNYELNADEKQVLNLGLNCHLQNKIDPNKEKNGD